MNFTLPKSVEFILDRFCDAGYAAYVVGGPVRDLLRGTQPSDYDITTSARPDEIKALFSDIRTIDTGIKHGTVTLLIDGSPYEVTTYRIDGEYLDARHPLGVEFTDDISLDLARRDFTMNAIAYNPRLGLVDTTGGAADIENRIIRCVGDPRVRFSEDALRILRAVRFAATLGFDIDAPTANAILELRDTTLLVSRERIYAELKKLISGDFAQRVIPEYIQLLSLYVPEWDNIKNLRDLKFTDSDFSVRIISLFAASGASGEEFSERMRSLRADNAIIKLGEGVLSALKDFDFNERRGLISLALALGADYARIACRVAAQIGITNASALAALEDILITTPTTLKQLNITGADLTALGYRGAGIKKALNELLYSAAQGSIKNERSTLLEVAKNEKNRII